MVNKKLVVIVTIIVVIIVGLIFKIQLEEFNNSHSGTLEEPKESSSAKVNETNNTADENVEGNSTENTTENKVEEENTTSENDTDKNEASKNTNTNSADKSNSSSSKTELTEANAIKLLKSKLSNKSNVYFYTEDEVSKGVYIISVRDNDTTETVGSYKVDLNKNTVTEN